MPYMLVCDAEGSECGYFFAWSCVCVCVCGVHARACVCTCVCVYVVKNQPVTEKVQV